MFSAIDASETNSIYLSYGLTALIRLLEHIRVNASFLNSNIIKVL
jgi:hypothetical protein